MDGQTDGQTDGCWAPNTTSASHLHRQHDLLQQGTNEGEHKETHGSLIVLFLIEASHAGLSVAMYSTSDTRRLYLSLPLTSGVAEPLAICMSVDGLCTSCSAWGSSVKPALQAELWPHSSVTSIRLLPAGIYRASKKVKRTSLRGHWKNRH